MQTKGQMRREYNSFSDLSRQFRMYDDRSVDSLQDHIEMNPNGCDELSLQQSHDDFCTSWPSSQASLLLLRQHNFKLKVYYSNVGNCVHCNKR